MDCIFCKIVNGELSSNTIYEDDIVKVFLDANPSNCGHSLVICKEHYKDIYDIPKETLEHIIKVAKDIGKYLEEKLNCQGFTLVQNNGIAEDIKHFHLHIIPKYDRKVNMSIQEVYEILKK